MNYNEATEQEFHVEVTAKLIELEGERYVIANSRDISERKKAAQLIQQTTALLEQTSSLARVGAYEWDITKNELIWSDVKKEIHELPHSYEPNLSTAISFYKEGLDRETIKTAIEAALKNGAPYDLELKIITAKGNERWVRALARTVFVDGKCLKIFGSLQDIHERKNQEEALKQLNEENAKIVSLQKIILDIATKYINLPVSKMEYAINESPGELADFAGADRAYIFDYDWNLKVCNNTYEYCSPGIEPQIESLQGFPLDYIPDWVQTHASGSVFYVANVVELDPESFLYQILATQEIKSLITIPMIEDGVCTGFIGFDYVNALHTFTPEEQILLKVFSEMLVNIRMRNNLVRNLMEETQNAQQANKAKSEFLANMSHEIRTPLNGVIGFTELLLKTPLSSVQEQYASHANSSGQALLGIVNDILDFSKIEAGKLELDLIPVDLFELVEQTTDIIKYHAGQKGLELLLNVLPAMPRIVVIDPVRLKQVLVNLLNNAVKFTDKGEVELKIAFENAADGHTNYRFTVRDTGIGISEKQGKKLFKEFSQADTSTTRKYGGTVLGLTISNLLVDKMGGVIEFTSIVNNGSEFFFTIALETQPYDAAEELGRLPIKSVLIIDDNTNNRQILEENFKHWEVDCTSTDNGLSALKILESGNHFDVLIVDYHMPYMDGLETIRLIRTKLKQTPDKLPIILLHSSTDDLEIREACKHLGVRFNLVKPVKATELHRFLKNIGSESVPHQQQDLEALNTSQAPHTNPERILIAEDIVMNKMLIRTLVKRLVPNAEIVETSNGNETITAYKSNNFDLILMDVQMPEVSGLTATKNIRAYENAKGLVETPIIALTAGALKEEREACLASGMNDFISKPIHTETLQAIFETFLHKKRKQQPVFQGQMFNKAALMERVNNDLELYRELLLATNDFETNLQSMHSAIHKGDLTMVKFASHRIKGAAATMGFERFEKMAQAIEIHALAGQKDIETLVVAIDAEWHALKVTIEKESQAFS